MGNLPQLQPLALIILFCLVILTYFYTVLLYEILQSLFYLWFVGLNLMSSMFIHIITHDRTCFIWIMWVFHSINIMTCIYFIFKLILIFDNLIHVYNAFSSLSFPTLISVSWLSNSLWLNSFPDSWFLNYAFIDVT